MLIIHVITFELAQHVRPRYINVTDGQTDERTDVWMEGRFTVAIPRNAHTELRGKKLTKDGTQYIEVVVVLYHT